MNELKNYHTHTYRCKHARGDVVDYAQEADNKGASVLGMTDHTALPDNKWLFSRMSYEELDGYEKAIEEAREKFPNLTILKGLECEYDEEYHQYFEDELLGKRGFDYLIGAGHYTPYQSGWLNSFVELTGAEALNAYAQYIEKSMASGLFAFIAHPDLFGCCNLDWNKDVEACSRDILAAAQDLKVPLEVNGNGFRKPRVQTPEGGKRNVYPWPSFWELAAEYDIEVVCNSDAHSPRFTLANIDDCKNIADQYQLKYADLSYLEKK